MLVDPDLIINVFLKVFMYLFPLLALIAFLKSPFFKGLFGEFFVNLLAKFFLDKNVYHLVKNVTLPAEDGTTQIDHIIVSRYGIFVVETKNLKGRIFGSENQPCGRKKYISIQINFKIHYARITNI